MKKLGNLFIDAEDGIKDVAEYHTLEAVYTFPDIITDELRGSVLNFAGECGIKNVDSPQDWNLGLNDFTIDFWINFNSISNQHIIEQSIDNSNRWQFWYTGSAWRIYSIINGSVNIDKLVNISVGMNKWYHMALTRQNGNFKVFRDGIVILSFNAAAYLGLDCPLYIGTYREAGTSYFNGNMDNIRLVKGEALWTENFELTDEELFYESGNVNPNRPDKITELYNLSSTKKNLRGKAKEGFIRPTISQFFTSKNFKIVSKALNFQWDTSMTDNYTYNSAGSEAIQKLPSSWHSVMSNKQISPADELLYFELTGYGSWMVGFSNTYYESVLTEGPGAFYVSFASGVEKTLSISLNCETGDMIVKLDGEITDTCGACSSWGPPMSYPVTPTKLIVSTFSNEGPLVLNAGQLPWKYEAPSGYTGYNQ